MKCVEENKDLPIEPLCRQLAMSVAEMARKLIADGHKGLEFLLKYEEPSW
jgi:hypothetical protein